MDATPATILIIEDEADTAEMFAEMMRLSGFKVRKTHGSAAAMALLEHEVPAAVLLDIMMPDVSGFEVLRFIRREPGLAKVPVIVISARGLPADVQNVLAAGANAYLTKPVGYMELNGAVLRAINGTV